MCKFVWQKRPMIENRTQEKVHQGCSYGNGRGKH